MKRNPSHYIDDAIRLASVGRDGWANAKDCPEGCDCSVCFALNAGLTRLNAALDEMKRWWEE